MFPYGYATASRVRTLAQGLKELGADVEVVTTARIPLREEDLDRSGRLIWEGVPYKSLNCNGMPGLQLGRTARLLNHIFAIFKSWALTKRMLNAKSCDAIYVFGWSFFAYLPIILLARWNRVPLALDVCEWFPPASFKYGRLSPLYWDDYLGRHLPFFYKNCGVIAISNYIGERYAKWRVPIMVIPSVIPLARFGRLVVDQADHHDTEFRIVYAGSCKKDDGVEYLIEAIRMAVVAGCHVRLEIVGSDGRSGLSVAHRLRCVSDPVLRDRVCFLGRVSEEEYTRALTEASCLALPRTASITNHAAFPTRLPEFLATGRPVLTTDVPDVPQYLVPGVHGEIVAANSPDSLAAGIVRLCRDPDRARRIGRFGRDRCLSVFAVERYSKKFLEFLSCPLRFG